MVEVIEMPFGTLDQVVPRSRVLDGFRCLHGKRQILGMGNKAAKSNCSSGDVAFSQISLRFLVYIVFGCASHMPQKQLVT